MSARGIVAPPHVRRRHALVPAPRDARQNTAATARVGTTQTLACRCGSSPPQLATGRWRPHRELRLADAFIVPTVFLLFGRRRLSVGQQRCQSSARPARIPWSSVSVKRGRNLLDRILARRPATVALAGEAIHRAPEIDPTRRAGDHVPGRVRRGRIDRPRPRSARARRRWSCTRLVAILNSSCADAHRPYEPEARRKR